MKEYNPVIIIEKKRDAKTLTGEEIAFFVNGFVEGRIPDYQMSALLMAICLQGMNIQETVDLTRAMLKSGERLDFSNHPGLPLVDKHSTGGVGDKLSLIALPTAAACGAYIPKISGRGLGHTGGTLDKLESIPGFSTDFNPREMVEAVVRTGAVMAGQSPIIAPADKKIYALRDVTATVDSIPLITASIISKKAAESIGALVLDVKAGAGALFRDWQRTEELARTLIATGEEFGLRTVCLITNMEQPLGYAVGNWLEVKECIDIMQTGSGAKDVMELSLALSGTMLAESGIAKNAEEGCIMAEKALKEGKSLAKFRVIVTNQGGDVSLLDNPERYPVAKHSQALRAESTGYISRIDARRAGETANSLGAGRMTKDDAIDHSAGITFHAKRGDYVETGDKLATLFSNSPEKLERAAESAEDIFQRWETAPETNPLIFQVMRRKGTVSWEKYAGL